MARTKLPDIRQIKSGKWLARSRVKGHPDTSRCFDSYAEAYEWKIAITGEKHKGIYADRSKAEAMTLKQGLQRFMDEVTALKKGKKARTESDHLKRLMAMPIAQYSLASLRPEHISHFKVQRLLSFNQRKPGQRLSQETVRKDMTKIGAVFSRAKISWGMAYLNNPVLDTELPPPTPHRERVFVEDTDPEHDEETRLFKAAQEYEKGRYVQLLKWLVSSGMRLQEACLIEWSRVDLQTSTFQILAWTTKGEKTHRRAMTPACLALLKSMPRPIRGGRIFPFVPDTVSQAFGRIASRAKLVNFCLHDLRHVALTRLSNLGLSAFQLMKFSGHSTPDMLYRYCQMDEKMAAANAARLMEESHQRAAMQASN